MLDPKGFVVATGTMTGTGLYRLDQPQHHALSAQISKSGTDITDWHRRWGYTNNRYVRKTAEYSNGMTITGKDPESSCESCLIGKATKATMKSIDHTETTLDLLYIDH